MRICPICASRLKGRSDKIFCSPKCKSIHQYEQRQENEGFFLKVERQLKINRKILKRYNKSGFTTVRTAELINEGFDPNFFTHYWKNKKGDVYLFVYEYGFLKTRKNTNYASAQAIDKYLLVKWQAYMEQG